MRTTLIERDFKMEWNRETFDRIVWNLERNGYDSDMAFETAMYIQKCICQWNEEPEEVLWQYGLTLKEIA